MKNQNLPITSALILLIFAVSIPVRVVRADSIYGYDKGEIHVSESGNQISAQYWCYDTSHVWKMCEDLGSFDKGRLQKAEDVRRTRGIVGNSIQIGGAFDSFAQFFFFGNLPGLLVGLGLVAAGGAIAGHSVPYELHQTVGAAQQGFWVSSAEDYKNRLKAAITWLQNDKKSAGQAVAMGVAPGASPAISDTQVKVLQSDAQVASASAPAAGLASGSAR